MCWSTVWQVFWEGTVGLSIWAQLCVDFGNQPLEYHLVLHTCTNQCPVEASCSGFLFWILRCWTKPHLLAMLAPEDIRTSLYYSLHTFLKPFFAGVFFKASISQISLHTLSVYNALWRAKVLERDLVKIYVFGCDLVSWLANIFLVRQIWASKKLFISLNSNKSFCGKEH